MAKKDETLSTVPEELIKKLPPQLPKELVITLMSEYFSGPLPPPHIIEGYEKVLPGAADRILRMAETQERHRQELERQRLNADIVGERRGMLFSFTLIVTVLVVGAVLIFNDKKVEGLATLLGGGGILLAINVWNRPKAISTTKRARSSLLKTSKKDK